MQFQLGRGNVKLSDLGMITRKKPSKSTAIEDWRELYLTALFETR
jgi:hypothetical protein